MYILKEHREEITIKKSRFLTCIMPVHTEQQARDYISQIRREFHDSSHICTAYVIGDHDEITRSSDNGEPSGTAGVPMAEAIRHADIHDLCACTVRWFGGIKLGAGGLIRAYSGSVTAAIQHAEKGQKVTLHRYKLNYPYSLSGTLETWLRQNTAITDMFYDEDVTATIETEAPGFRTQIADITNGEIKPVYLGDTEKIKPL